MSIGDKLTTIAENQQKVYDKGIEQGRQAVYDEFWDSYQNNGKRTDYNYMFSGKVWNDSRLKPKHKINLTNGNNMFRLSNITDLRPLNDVVNWSANYGVVAICRECSSLKYVGKIGVALDGTVSAQEMFHSCSSLISVEEFMISPRVSNLNHTFYNCTSLKDIKIIGTIGQSLDMQYSPLSKASIESIISCLSTNTTGKTLTLKKSAINSAFGINVDDATTYPEGSEYYTLRHSRDNWTISYV